ncbi:MAG: CRISPR-associated helicase Cas3' [Acidimicrobiia bacterium]|nr:CRISPR-associated helicase Cas3' [Acidimicrobiia bacterium]
MTDFGRFFHDATGYAPYPYQSRLAADGLPDVLRVDTGCGKTEAAGLAWMWRRRHSARKETPRWLVYALPMRTLVDQTFDRFVKWRHALGLQPSELGVHRVMGGSDWRDRDWRLHPERDAVFIGTIDMLLSRALNRGFADSRWNWPISFGAFNSGCQWVFDETQLMDAGVITGRQLQAFRTSFGTVQPTHTMWMSATVDFERLKTVDAPVIDRVVEISEIDRGYASLAERLEAPRSVRALGAGEVIKDGHVAKLAIEHHRPGTLTLVVVNTVKRAQAAFNAIRKIQGDVATVLIHSRFRQADREAALARVEADLGSNGRVVLATQVVEAGLDLSATTLLTDLAPWSSIVQRAGRCNRDGKVTNARMLWMRPPSAAPYDDEALQTAETALTQLPDVVTPRILSSVDVPTKVLPLPTLRRRDLVELFDTLPDLGGNYVDVGRFIRDSEDRDVIVLWREVENGALVSDIGPAAAELCRGPIGQLRRFLKAARKKPGIHAFKAVPSQRERWTRLAPGDLRPNLTVALHMKVGGYTPEMGWDSKSNKNVPAVDEPSDQRALPDQHDLCVADDPNSTGNAAPWLTLKEHLEDTEATAAAMVEVFGDLDLSPAVVQAARLAARYHDLGKVHDVFQDAIRKTRSEKDDNPPGSGVMLAKGGSKRDSLRYSRRYFRHGLVSALMLLGPEQALLEGVAEKDLVVYLTAAHHGRVRLGVRRLDDEPCPDNAACDIALGVVDGDKVPADVDIPRAVTRGGPISLAHVGLGSDDGPVPSYTARMLTLRDRSDLGPFRLAWLEMLVRSADWRASAHPRVVTS